MAACWVAYFTSRGNRADAKSKQGIPSGGVVSMSLRRCSSAFENDTPGGITRFHSAGCQEQRACQSHDSVRWDGREDTSQRYSEEAALRLPGGAGISGRVETVGDNRERREQLGRQHMRRKVGDRGSRGVCQVGLSCDGMMMRCAP